jgi:serine/threonine protein kinase
VKGYEGHVEHPPLEAGAQLLPGYEVVGHLHQSRNYDVYDVFSEERACRCIAKTPRGDLLDDDKVRRALLREGRLLKKLTHPHIVRHYETIKEPYPALILETLTGATLSHIVDNAYRRLPLAEVAHLGLHLCSAMHYLHGHGILHLDLKPSNIVSERGLAKILDLSIARPPGRARKGAGTRQYMAPEQVLGGTVSPATDVWGIGATLYEAATDETPFNAEYETSSGYATNSEHDDLGGEDSAGEDSAGEDSAGEDSAESDPQESYVLETDTGYDPEEYEQVRRRVEPVRRYRRVPADFARAIEDCLEPDPARRPTVGELSARLDAFVRAR